MVVHVRHDRVEVRAPGFVTDQQIAVFVHTHVDWIIRKLEHKANQDAQKLRLEEGGCIFYKARTLTIRFVPDTTEHVVVTDSEFRIHGSHFSAQGASRILQRWLLAQARAILPERTRALANYLNAGKRLKEVVFRKTRTKWGHCTSSGRIQFNWLIMMAPDAIIDYMICHEACHLVHMNHSPRFWALVESVCPDYRIYVRWLKKHEHRLWL
jgi:predicted metal-dependent hydrolase